MSSIALNQTISSIGEFVKLQVSERRFHTRSLISTFFGDVVLPNDHYAWVETICAAMEPLGVNDRLVRTTLFRMAGEGWMQSTRSGRKSYYQLSEDAQRQTNLAERLIYYPDLPAWDGSWTLVFLVIGEVDPEVKNEFIQELRWIGFGSVTKGVWAHPGSNFEIVGELVNQLELQNKVICMSCKNIQDAKLGLPIDDRKLAALCMPVTDAEVSYNEFITNYSPLLDDNGNLKLNDDAMQLLSLRILMVDEFRRVRLKDSHLPKDLLPKQWAGHTAFELCGAIYKQIYQATNLHYQALQKNAGHPEALVINQSNLSPYKQRFNLGSL